ncbi:zinc finger, CCHC-type containing protein, partial [Tanacetum coccineum]
LPEGNNVVPLRSDTIRLVQNGCSFYGLQSVDPNQHLKDFIKLVDSLDLNGDNSKRKRLRLFQFSLRGQASNWLERLSAGSISTWEDLTTRFLAQFVPPRRSVKLCNDILMFQQHQGKSLSEAWAHFNYLLQKSLIMASIFGIKSKYSTIDEGWNDLIILEEGNLDYENPDIEQLLGVMEHKVDTFMKDAISLIGGSEGVFRITSNETYQLLSEPSRQEEFEHIVTNFILDQEERAMSKRTRTGKSTKEKSSRSQEPSAEDKIQEFGVFDNEEFLATHGLAKEFFDSINTDPFTEPQWAILFQINEPVYLELVWEFFSSFEFEATSCRYNSAHVGVSFRLGGETRTMSLVELGWRVGLYSKRESRLDETKRELNKGETVKAEVLTMGFWPNIADDEFVVGRKIAKRIRDPRVRLAHRCIATTILGKRNQPTGSLQWIYFSSIASMEKGITRSFRLLTNVMRDALHVEPKAHVFKKRSLIAMDVVMDIGGGACCWPATRQDGENDEVEEAANEGVANEEVGGSVKVYRNMSQCDWQVRQARWMDQQDTHLGRLDTWMGQQDERANWMYDHTVRQFRYMSTRDNLDPHLQITTTKKAIETGYATSLYKKNRHRFYL